MTTDCLDENIIPARGGVDVNVTLAVFYAKTATTVHAWCVRGPMNADALLRIIRCCVGCGGLVRGRDA